MSFEVGKKYHQKGTQNLFEPVFIGKQSAFGVFTHYALSEDLKKSELETCLPHGYLGNHWVEYKEPRSLTRWANIWEDPKGKLSIGTSYDTEELAKQKGRLAAVGGHKLLDTIEVKWTEKM